MRDMLAKISDQNELSIDQISKEIIKAKWTGKRFIAMDKEELRISIETLLGQIKMITGWNLPPIFDHNNQYTLQGKAMMNEMATTLKTNYENLTHSEIVLAFRNHSHKLKEYGKDFNINFLHEVMNGYSVERQEAIQLEQKIIDQKQEQKMLSQEQLENLTRKSIEETYQSYLQGHTEALNSLSGHINYEQLVADKIVDKDLWIDFMLEGFAAHRAELSMLLPTATKAEAAQIKERLQLLDTIEKNAKRKAFIYALEYVKNKNRAHIYQTH